MVSHSVTCHSTEVVRRQTDRLLLEIILGQLVNSWYIYDNLKMDLKPRSYSAFECFKTIDSLQKINRKILKKCL